MRSAEISQWTGALISSLGKPRTPVSENELKQLFVAKDYSSMVRLIRDQMKLDTRLRVGLVNSGGPKDSIAWLERLGNAALYGTQEFANQTYTLYVRKDFLAEVSFGPAVVAMATQMAVIVLVATRQPLRDEAGVAELTAMLLGYREFFLKYSQYTIVPKTTDGSKEKIENMVGQMMRDFFGSKKYPDNGSARYSMGQLTEEERHFAAQMMAHWL